LNGNLTWWKQDCNLAPTIKIRVTQARGWHSKRRTILELNVVKEKGRARKGKEVTEPGTQVYKRKTLALGGTISREKRHVE